MKNFAFAGVVAGLLLALVGMLTNPSTDAASAQPAALGIDIDPITGLAPIERVVQFFDERAADRPSDYLTRTQLGSALITQAREQADLGTYEAAERVFTRALELNPQHLSARLGLARALHAQHRFEEARSLASHVAAETGDMTAELLAADAAFELGDYDDAAATYAHLLAGKRTAVLVSRSARIAWVTGDGPGASRLANEAFQLSSSLALRPNAAAFYAFQVGHFAWLEGDGDAAVAALTSALEIDPRHVGAAELLAGVQAARGDLAGAASSYAALIDRGAAPDLHGAYADVLRASGRPEAAAEQERLGAVLAAETMDRFPAERRHLVGYFLDRDPAVALRLAEADFAERQDVGAFETLARALHRNDRSEEAVPLIDAAFDHGQRSAPLFYLAGVIAHDLGNEAEAVDHLSAALAINPQFAFADADHARSLLRDLAGSPN